MRSPISYIACTAAICGAVLGLPFLALGCITSALITELLAVPRPPTQ